MAIPNAVNATVRVGLESTFGTKASASSLIRRVSSSLALTKDSLQSAEARPDGQVQDLRHGMRRVTGQIQGELSADTYTSLFAGALRTTASAAMSPGILTPSFSIEQYYEDADISELFLGCRVGECSVNMSPGQMATVTFGFLGQDMTPASGGSAPQFADPTAATTTNVLSGIDGSLTYDGSANTVVTGFELSINNSLSAAPVVGSNKAPNVFYGRMVVSGSVSAYFDTLAAVNAFLAEEEVAIVVTLDGIDGTSMTFTMPRVKMMGMSKTIGTEGGVILQSPFQALYDAAGTVQIATGSGGGGT